MMTELEILFQDQHFVAINKPEGLLVHRTALAKGEKWFAMQMLRDQLGCHVFPVHRLDRPTSGVLLFALSKEDAGVMSIQFAERKVDKEYLAVVRGYIDAYGEIDYPLKEKLDKMTDKQVDPDKEAQPAITEYTRLDQVELDVAVGRYPTSRYSFVHLKPKTGRKHQLRRHMEHIFHPIIGDTTHGDGRHNRFFKQEYGFDRLALVSHKLSFIHPYTEESIQIQATLGQKMSHLLDALGWQESVNKINIEGV